jgi:hypothetical protein
MYKEILTNPQNHNPDNFIYVTHGISDRFTMHSEEGISVSLIKQKVERIRGRKFFYCGALVGRLDQETAKNIFSQYKINLPISQLDTYGEVGLILDIANDSVIYAASASDFHSPKKQEELKEFAIKHKGQIEKPLSLLLMGEGTEFGISDHNEMILIGHPETNISGIFYQDSSSKTENEGKLLMEIVSELENKEIVIIALPQPIKKTLIGMGKAMPLGDYLKLLSRNGVIRLRD